jgi:hypothetical protein
MICRLIAILIVCMCTELAAGPLAIDSAKLVENYDKIFDDSGNLIRQELVYQIVCKMKNMPSDPNELANLGESLILEVNWKIIANKKPVEIEDIIWRNVGAKAAYVMLVGSFENVEYFTVQYKDSPSKKVSMDKSTAGQTRWGFGEGEALNFSVRRLAKQESFLAFDYNFDVDVLEYNLMPGRGWLWINSLSFAIESKGIFASDDEVRNGTRSTLKFEISPYYFVGGLIYNADLYFGYCLETRMNDTANTLFDVISQRPKVGLELEIPWSNKPMFWFHSKTGYARLAMPLTVGLEYLPKEEDIRIWPGLARLELYAYYELAFSPYLIVQGKVNHTKFFDVPEDLDEETTYYSIAFAQDLDAVKKALGFLTFILGDSEEMEGKNFLYYKITFGRGSPSFQDTREQSFGFGMYF